VAEERIVREFTMCHIVGKFADEFFELSGVMARDGEQVAEEKQVK
jgi:hypothetical protein